MSGRSITNLRKESPQNNNDIQQKNAEADHLHTPNDTMNTSTGSRKSRNRLVFVSRPKKKRTPVTAVPVFRNPLQPADSPPPSETRLPYGGEESISSSAPEESPPLDHSPVLGEDSAPFAQENHDNREEEVHRDDYYLTGVKVHFLSLPPLPLALVLSYCTHEVVLQLRQVNRLFNQLYLTDVVANCFQTLPGREEALLGGTNAAGGPLTAHGGRVADIIVKRRQAYRQCRLVEDRRRQAWQYHTIGLAKKEEDPLHELRRAQAATALAAHSLQVAVTEYLHYCSRQRMVRYNIRNGLFNLTTFGAKPGVPGLEGVPLFKLLLHETDDPLHRGQVCILPGGVLGIWFYEETDFCIYVKQKKSQYLRSVGAFAGQDYYEEEVFYQKYMDQNTRDNANRYLFWPKNKKKNTPYRGSGDYIYVKEVCISVSGLDVMSQYLRLTALPAPANQRLPYGLKTEPEGVFYNAHDNTINIIQSTGCIFSFRYYPRSSWALTNRIDRRALPAVPVCGREGEEAPRMEKALERYTQLPGYVAPLDPTALRRLSSYYYSVLRSHSLPSGATGSPFHNDFDLHADKQWQPPHKANRYVELELVDCYATYNPGQMQLSEFRDVFLPRSASTLPLPTYRWDREKIQSVQTTLGEAAGGQSPIVIIVENGVDITESVISGAESEERRGMHGGTTARLTVGDLAQLQGVHRGMAADLFPPTTTAPEDAGAGGRSETNDDHPTDAEGEAHTSDAAPTPADETTVHREEEVAVQAEAEEELVTFSPEGDTTNNNDKKAEEEEDVRVTFQEEPESGPAQTDAEERPYTSRYVFGVYNEQCSLLVSMTRFAYRISAHGVGACQNNNSLWHYYRHRFNRELTPEEIADEAGRRVETNVLLVNGTAPTSDLVVLRLPDFTRSEKHSKKSENGERLLDGSEEGEVEEGQLCYMVISHEVMIYRATVLRRKVYGFTARAVTADSLSPHGCVVTHYVSVGYHYYPESVEPTPILEIFRMSQMASPRPWLSDRLMAIHEHEVVEGKRYARRLDRVNARLNALSGKTIPFPEEVRPAFMDAIEKLVSERPMFYLFTLDLRAQRSVRNDEVVPEQVVERNGYPTPWRSDVDGHPYFSNTFFITIHRAAVDTKVNNINENDSRSLLPYLCLYFMPREADFGKGEAVPFRRVLFSSPGSYLSSKYDIPFMKLMKSDPSAPPPGSAPLETNRLDVYNHLLKWLLRFPTTVAFSPDHAFWVVALATGELVMVAPRVDTEDEEAATDDTKEKEAEGGSDASPPMNLKRATRLLPSKQRCEILSYYQDDIRYTIALGRRPARDPLNRQQRKDPSDPAAVSSGKGGIPQPVRPRPAGSEEKKKCLVKQQAVAYLSLRYNLLMTRKEWKTATHMMLRRRKSTGSGRKKKLRKSGLTTNGFRGQWYVNRDHLNPPIKFDRLYSVKEDHRVVAANGKKLVKKVTGVIEREKRNPYFAEDDWSTSEDDNDALSSSSSSILTVDGEAKVEGIPTNHLTTPSPSGEPGEEVDEMESCASSTDLREEVESYADLIPYELSDDTTHNVNMYNRSDTISPANPSIVNMKKIYKSPGAIEKSRPYSNDAIFGPFYRKDKLLRHVQRKFPNLIEGRAVTESLPREDGAYGFRELQRQFRLMSLLPAAPDFHSTRTFVRPMMASMAETIRKEEKEGIPDRDSSLVDYQELITPPAIHHHLQLDFYYTLLKTNTIQLDDTYYKKLNQVNAKWSKRFADAEVVLDEEFNKEMKQDVQDALKEMELYHFRTSTSKEEKEVCQFREPFFNYNNTVRIEEIKIREDTLVTIDGMCEVVVYDTRILQPTTTGRPRRNDVDRFYHDFLGLPLIVPLFSVGVTPHPSSQRFTYDYPTFDKMFLRSFYCALNRHLGIIPNLNLYPASTSNPGALRERLLLGDGYVIVRPTGGLTKCIVLDFDVDFISRKEDGTLVRRHTPDSIRRFRCCPGDPHKGDHYLSHQLWRTFHHPEGDAVPPKEKKEPWTLENADYVFHLLFYAYYVRMGGRQFDWAAHLHRVFTDELKERKMSRGDGRLSHFTGMDLWLPWMELLHVDRRLPRPWKVLSIGRGQGKSRSLSHEKGASPEIRSMCSMVWEHRPNSRPDEICSSEFLVDYVSRYVTSKENFNLFHPCRTPYLKVPNTRNSFDYVYLIGFAPLVTLFMPATYIFYMIFIAFHSSGGYMFASGPDGEPEWYTVNKRTYRRYRDVAPVALLYAFGLPVLLAFCFRDIVNRPWRQACLENVLGVLGSFIWLVASPLLYLVKLTLEPPYDLALDLECSGVLREKFRECVYLTSDEQKGFLTDFSNYPRSYLVHNRLQRREEQIGYLRETGNSMYYTFPLTHLQLGIIFMGGVGISVVGHYISYARSVGNGHWTAALCCFFCAPVGSLQESTGVYVYRPSIWVYLLLFAASLILFGHYFDGPLSDERFDEPRFHYILLFVPTFVAVVLYAVVPLLIWVVHGICKRASLTVTAASDTILPAVIALVPTYQNFCSSYWFALVVGLVYFLSSMFGLVFGILSLERYWRSILIPRWLTTEVFQPSYVVLILLPLWPLPMIMMIVMLGYFGSNVAVVRFVRQVCKVKRP